jgi:hypothetical protein
MARQDLRPRPFEHLRILPRLLDVGEHAELGRDGDGEVLVQSVYCASNAISCGIQCRHARFTQRKYQISILQKSAVAPPPCDVLRTPEVDIEAIVVPLHDLGGGKEVLGVIGAELHDERPVGGGVSFFAGGDVEELVAVFFRRVCEELGGMGKELEKVNDMTWMNMTRSPTVDSKKKDRLGVDHRGVNELCSRATQDAS